MRYNCWLVNQPWEDPALLMQINDSREYWLFDCGELYQVSVGHLMDTTKVFVTHTHVDHFIGFDRLLRMNLREAKELQFYGPPGIAAQVGSRLQGYSWNLTDDSEFVIKCCELEETKVVSYLFRASNRFVEDIDDRRAHPLTHPELRLEDGSMLRFAPVVHGVECLCYSLTEPLQARLKKEEFKRSGLPAGPWIAQLLKICSGQVTEPPYLEVCGMRKGIEELRPLVFYPKPGRCAYVTDTVFNRESMASMHWVAQGADVLWSEACFRHAQRDKAVANFHLTARQVGRIAKELEVGELHLFHYSRRYRGELWPHIREAQENFPHTTPPPQLVPAPSAELAPSAS